MPKSSKPRSFAWKDVEEEWLNPKISRRMVIGENAMLARLILKKGSFVPPHKHISEQISSVVAGSLEFKFGRKSVKVGPGEVLVIPPNVVHSALALEDTDAIDAFSPLREDWLSGDDSYLRTGKSTLNRRR